MKRTGLVLLLALVICCPSPASAQGLYASIRGGPGWTPDVQTNLVSDQSVVSFNTGFTGGAAVGYASSLGLRLEGEFGYIYAPVDREDGRDISGSIKSYMLMVNAGYELQARALGPFKPYVGFGIGGARVSEDRETVFVVPSVTFILNDTRTAFTYQARVGVGYEVSRWLDVSAGYRYVHIDGTSRDSVIPGFVIRTDGINNHSLEFGVTLKF